MTKINQELIHTLSASEAQEGIVEIEKLMAKHQEVCSRISTDMEPEELFYLRIEAAMTERELLVAKKKMRQQMKRKQVLGEVSC
jgi:hypothetical protein